MENFLSVNKNRFLLKGRLVGGNVDFIVTMLALENQRPGQANATKKLSFNYFEKLIGRVL